MKWTKRQIEMLVKHYPHKTAKEVARYCRRPVFSVYNKANQMGIQKSPEYLEEFKRKSIEYLVEGGKKTRFKTGETSHNKGKKMSDEIRKKIEHTFFEKGRIPHNTKFDGHERIDSDGYVYIRISLGKYVLKHRYVYEQQIGPIPAKHAIWFRDGNRQNCSLDNLELVHVSELAKRNHIHHYPTEIKELIRLNNKIKKQIKNEKQDH